MDEEDVPAWRADAIELYRVVSVALSEADEPDDPWTEYLIDEVREELFDLKQAVMTDNKDFATRAAAEIVLLFNKLRNRDAE